MIESLKFNHIGIAVFSIDKTAKVYLSLGYKKSETVFDPIQNVNICFLEKDNLPMIELVEPVDENSPVNETLKKNGVTPYHCCYEVDDIEVAAGELQNERFIPTCKAVKAIAFGNKMVQFFYNKNVGLVELVEK